MINHYVLGSNLTWITTLALVIFVFLSKRRSRLIKAFCSYMINIAAWSFGWSRMALATDPVSGLFWARALHVGAIIIPTTFFHFALAFRSEALTKKWKVVMGIGYLCTIFFLSISFSGLFVPHTANVSGMKYYPQPGPLYLPYFIFFAIYSVLAFGMLAEAYREASGLKRTQMKYAFIAYAIAWVGGAPAFLPVWGYTMSPYSLYGVPICMGILSYAVLAHRLLDIELVSRDIITKSLTWTLVGVPLLLGTLLAYFLGSRPGFLYSRGPGDFICIVLNYALTLTLLRNYGDPHFRRLRLFFVLLGSWMLSALPLVLPPQGWSTGAFRLGYGFGTLVLLAWFYFWQGYFDNAKSLSSKVLRWILNLTVPVMWVLSLHTAWIIKALRFDPEGVLPAIEIPGRWHPLYGFWFVSMLLLMGLWAFYSLRGLPKTLYDGLKKWVVGCYGLATCAAASYFIFVMQKGSWPPVIHQGTESLTCLALVWALSQRMRLLNPSNVHPVGLGFGVISLVLPFIAGAMLAQPLMWRVIGALTVALFAPKILNEIQESVQVWVDRYLFKGFSYLTDYKKMAREALPQVENLREFLPMLAQRIVEKGQVQSCRVVVVEGLTKRPRFQAVYTAGSNGSGAGPASGSEAVPASQPWPDAVVPPLLERLARCSEVLLQEDLVKDGIVPRLVPAEEMEALVPLRQEGQTFGMIVVGPKVRRGAMVNQEDIKALTAIAEGVSHAVWANLAHYEQILKVEQTLHDVINFQRNVQVQLLRGKGQTPQMLTSLEMGLDLLRDLRFSNLVTLQRQRGEGLEMRLLDLGMVVAGVAEGLVPRAEAKGLKLAWTVAQGLPEVRGNRQALTRVFENLINNAIKYTVQGEIRVTVEAGTAGTVRTAVRDTGLGIVPEHLPHLFEPFYRVKGQSLEEGTGLGLLVVKELVELHGGRVRVESQIGQGSRFSVELAGQPKGGRHG